MHASIQAIAAYLPEEVLTTERLAGEHPEWGVPKIDARTGIARRHIAAPEECSSDLAARAGEALFATGACEPGEIDFLLLCTETPDYLLPPTGCLVQHKLGLPHTVGSLDFNLGSSGYVYGLGLAEGLIQSGQARTVLLLTADTYSKLLHPEDRSVRTIFGDAATATLLRAGPEPCLGPFRYGTNGAGAPNLIVPAGGLRRPRSAETAVAVEDENGNRRAPDNLFMNGAEIFNFTLDTAPGMVEDLLRVSGRSLDNIDLFVFHQANQTMLEHLRKRAGIPAEKFVVALRDYGNTVSSTIPLALRHAAREGKCGAGKTVLLAGFGVGYSWGATLWRCGSEIAAGI